MRFDRHISGRRQASGKSGSVDGSTLRRGYVDGNRLDIALRPRNPRQRVYDMEVRPKEGGCWQKVREHITAYMLRTRKLTLGREMQLFLIGYVIVSICEIFTIGGFPLDSPVRRVC
jgi:hypothetical protein